MTCATCNLPLRRMSTDNPDMPTQAVFVIRDGRRTHPVCPVDDEMPDPARGVPVTSDED